MKIQWLIILLLMLTKIFALDIPDKPNSRVLDLANLMSTQQQQNLNSKLHQIYLNKNGVDIVILTIPTLESEVIEDLAIKTARRWNLGEKKLDNGLLILVAKKEKSYRIEVGYGLEGSLPDGYIGNAERKFLSPNFKLNNYYFGLNALIDDLNNQIKLDNSTKKPPESDTAYSLIAVFGGMVGFIIIVTILYLRQNKWFLNTPIGRSTTFHIIANILFILQIFFIIIRWFIPSKSNNDDSIGGGGGFGGGGSSGKW